MTDDYRAKVESEVLKRFNQSKAHIAVSLTDKCPLRCKHCIVSAVHGGRVDLISARKLAKRIEDELLTDNHRIGMISFTGGEAPLARDSFKSLGQAARDSGVKTALITSGYWASTDKSALAFLDNHSFLDKLTVSIDRYHQEYLSVDVALNAIKAANSARLPSSVRLSRQRIDPQSDDLIKYIESQVENEIEIQFLVDGGRAENEVPDDFVADDDQVLSQCFTTGPHIDYDGSMLPCCSNLIHIERDHSLRLGNVFDMPLGKMLDRYYENQLLTTLRIFGWDYIRDEVGIAYASGLDLACHGGCRQCAAVLGDGDANRKLTNWAKSDSPADAASLAQQWVASASETSGCA